MTPEELTLIRVQYSEPWTVDEQNAQRVIYSLAGEIERLWMQLTAANARIAELEAKLNAVPVDAIRTIYGQLDGDDLYDDIGDELDDTRLWLNQVRPVGGA